MNYRFYYCYQSLGDILFLLFSDEKCDHFTKIDDISYIFSKDNNLIGINFFNISKIVKIKAQGMILNPILEFIDVINAILAKDNIVKLPYSNLSGFSIATILDVKEHPLDDKKRIISLKLFDKYYTSIASFCDLKINDRVVIANNLTFLADGTLFKKTIQNNIPIDVKIVSKKDIYAFENDKLYLVNEGECENFYGK